MQKQSYTPDFIFALEWLSYRLEQSCRLIGRPQPHLNPVVLDEYRVDGLRRIATLVFKRLPSSEEHMLTELDFFRSATQEYSKEVRNWLDSVGRDESEYLKEYDEQREIDEHHRSQGYNILVPTNCIYYHENAGEVLANFVRQDLGVGIENVGLRHRNSAESCIDIVPVDTYHKLYLRTCRIQPDGIWRNQQLVDHHFRTRNSPILWPAGSFSPMQYYDRQCVQLKLKEGWLHWDDVDKFEHIDEVFMFCGTPHKFVSWDQYSEQSGLPYRVPEVPVGRIYIPAMLSYIEKAKERFGVLSESFITIVSLLKSIACDLVGAEGFVTRKSKANDIIEDLDMGIQPRFIHEISVALSRMFSGKTIKGFELDILNSIPKENDDQKYIYLIQDKIFTDIYNWVSSNQIRNHSKVNKSKDTTVKEMAVRFFETCTKTVKINTRAAATYGVITLEKKGLTDTEVFEEIKTRFKEWDIPSKNICKKSRQVFVNHLGCEFESSPIGAKTNHENVCVKMEPVLVEVIKKISEKNYRRKDF